MKLIDDARLIWKRWSVWILAAVVAFNGYFLTLPEKLQDAVPHQLLAAVAMIGGIAAIGVMPIAQKSLSGKADA